MCEHFIVVAVIVAVVVEVSMPVTFVQQSSSFVITFVVGHVSRFTPRRVSAYDDERAR
jgi:hypothetical protein